MPARLSGSLDWSGGPRDGTVDVTWAADYRVLPPWQRSIRHVGRALVVVDTCGESSLPACLAVHPETQSGVAGTIRLDGAGALRTELAAASAVPAGDAALVLAGYLRWGPAVFSRLAGDFSFLLWDERAQTGYLVRDPFGVRRLHYAAHRDGLVFSTDVEGVLAWPRIDRSPDEVTILDNLLARHRTREQTFFRAIKRVLPGHHLVVRHNHTSLVRHREVPRHTVTFRSIDEYAEAFRFELARSVEERLPATGPVACHVSGGLDSMSIAALARSELDRKGRPRDLALLTARFIGLPTDEGFVAQELARRLGVPVQEWDGCVPETSDLEQPRMAWPFGRASIAGAWQGDLALAERSGASILFGGAGGNQVAVETGFFRDAWQTDGLPGYLRAVAGVARSAWWRWPLHRLRRTFAEARRVIPAALSTKPRNSIPSSLDLSPPDWLGPRLRAAWAMLPVTAASPANPRVGGWMADAVWAELVEDPVLVWTLEHEDARANERGMEFRFPYLSWAMLRLALAVPARLRQPTEVDRGLQRRALQGVLPERLRLRDTFVNFNESIMLNTLAAREWIEKLLASGPWASEGLVDRRMALDKFRRLSASASDVYTYERAAGWREIRDVAALEAWLRRL